jgi:putative hydrolase of the HAD superfamily
VIRAILFDLDETLYPAGTGVMDHFRGLMLDYIRTHLLLSAEEAEALRRKYFQAYGTTMRGLQLNHGIDPDEFLAFVHDLPLELYLEPNPELDAALARLPQEKVVFTNASREHAERVLAILGIGRHFERIVDVRDVGYESKPQPGAYRRICELLRVEPWECAIVEDSARNLLPARALGMATVLVQADGAGAQPGVDVAIERIEEIEDAIRRVADRP